MNKFWLYQGTAQPVRCTVVFEWRPEIGPAKLIPRQLPLEEIENIILLSLCPNQEETKKLFQFEYFKNLAIFEN
jgi:hypothetical protein